MQKLSVLIAIVLLFGVSIYAYHSNSRILSAMNGLDPKSIEGNIEPNIIEPHSVIGDYTINEPIVEGKLQIFLISGNDELKGKKYTTLAKALEQKLVQVVETGSVNELSINNLSDEYVFIHSGDIVKGGKQDRTMAYDVIIPPKSKNIPLQSFCVEQGRWQQREGERVNEFESTSKMLSSRKLKLAAKYENDQGKVWQSVAGQQERLKENVSRKAGREVEVKSELSESSLQLTLESEELKVARKEMEEVFSTLLDDNTGALGYAYAINGEILGADIYNNKILFNELWGKIIESVMTEAISSKEVDQYSLATSDDVVSFIQALEVSDVQKSSKSINETTDMSTLESESGNLEFSVIDKEEGKWIHKNYMKKEKSVR